MQRNSSDKYLFQNKSLKKLPGERWKEIPGWGDYEVSNYERVRSIGRWIRLNFGKEGYKEEKILPQQIRTIPSPFNGDVLNYLSVGLLEHS
jgi:hypothetical protein